MAQGTVRFVLTVVKYWRCHVAEKRDICSRIQGEFVMVLYSEGGVLLAKNTEESLGVYQFPDYTDWSLRLNVLIVAINSTKNPET